VTKDKDNLICANCLSDHGFRLFMSEDKRLTECMACGYIDGSLKWEAIPPAPAIRELKPCPHVCGTEPYSNKSMSHNNTNKGHGWLTGCSDCGTYFLGRSNDLIGAQREAEDRWNERPLVILTGDVIKYDRLDHNGFRLPNHRAMLSQRRNPLHKDMRG